MIVIQIILIIGLLFMMTRLLSTRNTTRTNASKKLGLFLFMIAAIVVVLFPDMMNSLAHAVGVGRGADLLLYFVTLAFIFSQLNGYVKSKEEQRRLVILARKVAILESIVETPLKTTSGKKK